MAKPVDLDLHLRKVPLTLDIPAAPKLGGSFQWVFRPNPPQAGIKLWVLTGEARPRLVVLGDAGVGGVV